MTEIQIYTEMEMKKLIAEYTAKINQCDKNIAEFSEAARVAKSQGLTVSMESHYESRHDENIRRQCYVQFIKDLEYSV